MNRADAASAEPTCFWRYNSYFWERVAHVPLNSLLLKSDCYGTDPPYRCLAEILTYVRQKPACMFHVL